MKERKRLIKFLKAISDERISWKDHIKKVENKIARHLRLLYQTKQLINTSSLKSIKFSYIHTYLNYPNIVWASIQKKNKLKTINIKQKHTVRSISNENRLCYSRPLLKTLNGLGIY